ncbi:MAG TPA: rod shape-determining protein MreD [Acidimicrobiia bacterium]
MTWNTRLRLFLLVVSTVVLQTTLFPDLRFFGVAPDLGLVATIAVAYRVGPQRGALYGFANGLALDLFLQTPFGLSALSFAVVGYGVGIVQAGMSQEPRFAAPLLSGLGGLVGGAVFVAVAALAGEDQVLATRTLWVLPLAAAYDALLGFVLFPVGRWATRGAEAPAARGARSL